MSILSVIHADKDKTIMKQKMLDDLYEMKANFSTPSIKKCIKSLEKELDESLNN